MFLKRLLASLLLLAAATCSPAATISERSPFFQGHWWDPTHSGHGFEIFNAAGNVMAIWYTYDAAGKPIWYTAQGLVTELGQAWPLTRHQWSAGHISQSTVVGDLKLVVNHSEQIDAQWRFGTNTGAWSLRPYVVSTLSNDVDHTGHWFDPTQSGWGFTLTEQGDTLGSVLYAYDAAGAPTWVAGFGRGFGNIVDFYRTSGTCPECPYAGITQQRTGSVAFDYAGEGDLTIRSALIFDFAPGISFNGAHARQLGRPASLRAADRQLAHFDGDTQLREFLVASMLHMPPLAGGIDFSAAPPTVSYSPTNLQEQGVDEAGLVKTDGRFVYAFKYNSGAVPLPSLRFAEIGNDGASLSFKGNVGLLPPSAPGLQYTGLVLHDNHLVAITGTQPTAGAVNPWLSPSAWMNGLTRVEIMDVGADGMPVRKWTAEFEGHPLATRRIGDRLFVMSRFAPYVKGFQYGYGASAENLAALASAPLSALQPKVRVNGGDFVPLAEPQAVYAPPLGGRTSFADMVFVTAIDLAQPRIAQSLGVLTTADAFYMAPESLYLATTRTNSRDIYGNPFTFDPPFYLTDLHRIALGAEMTVVGTGTVEGYLDWDPDIAPFRLSEQDNCLRVMTSSSSMWQGTTNRLTVLEPSQASPGLLKTVAFLPNDRHPEPLGKPNERLMGTRFAGDRLFLVTFRQVDPLYVVNLSQPADPVVSGSVELTGFSQYLHPLSTGQLLGFGRDASTTGMAQGLQLALYDIDASGSPVEVQRLSLGQRGSLSALEKNHQAFSALMNADGSGTFAFPARITEGTPDMNGQYPWAFSGLLRFDLRWSSPTELRMVPLDFLFSQQKSTSTLAPWPDAATDNARSVLLKNGTVYVGYGLFWHQDSTGTTTGPF